MKQFVYLWCLFCGLSACTSDNNTFIFENTKTTFENVKAAELNEGSSFLGDTLIFTQENLPEQLRDSVDRQIRFLRNPKSDFPLKIKHYYDSQSREVYCTIYQWDRFQSQLKGEALQEALAKDVDRQQLYVDIFDNVGRQMIDQYGNPNKGHGDLRKENFKMLDIWSRKLIWDLDKEYLELNMYWVPKKGYHIFKVYVIHYLK